MKRQIICIIVGLWACVSCSESNKSVQKKEVVEVSVKQNDKYKTEHPYGSWYCPDNLTNFPPVNIKNWESVPVVNGRLPTKEEARNGTSLIYFDPVKYPDAQPIDMKMPKLARFYNVNTRKKELVIVIEAVVAEDDTITGFRYLNGGNGSARIHKIDFLTESEVDKLSYSSFVHFKMKINASPEEIWSVMTEEKYAKQLQSIFDENNELSPDWKKRSKVNFKYFKEGVTTSEYASLLFGSYYAQRDYDFTVYQHVEKFLLLESENKKYTELNVVCGPYGYDFLQQQAVLMSWAGKVKALSEDDDC